MAISVTRDDIKRRCMIDVSDYDTKIDKLRDEMVATLNYWLLSEHKNTTNTDLQALLNLGALEIIAGTFLDQLRELYGRSEGFSIDGISVDPFKTDGKLLIEEGVRRLAPFLAEQSPFAIGTAIDQDPEAN